MKNVKLILVALFSVITLSCFSQNDDTPSKAYSLTLHDGSVITGVLLDENDKEIKLETENIGIVTIPKYTVKTIEDAALDGNGNPIKKPHNPTFATRYFLTTNGLSIPKGEIQTMFSLLGWDLNYGITENVSVGVMASWIGAPIIANVKYTKQLSEDLHVGAGLLAGTGSWTASDFGGVLPYGTLTLGNRRSNLNFSAGYGKVFLGQRFDNNNGNTGSAMISGGGIFALNDRLSLVFDSFLLMNNNSINGFLTPGIRLASKRSETAYQVGFMGLVADAELLPVPIPSFRLFKKF